MNFEKGRVSAPIGRFRLSPPGDSSSLLYRATPAAGSPFGEDRKKTVSTRKMNAVLRSLYSEKEEKVERFR